MNNLLYVLSVELIRFNFYYWMLKNIGLVLVFVWLLSRFPPLAYKSVFDPWTTRFWTPQIHFYVDFFSVVNTIALHHSWMQNHQYGGSMYMEGQHKWCIKVWLCRGSAPLTLTYVQGPIVFWISSNIYLFFSSAIFSTTWFTCSWFYI